MRLQDVSKSNPNAILISSGILFDVFNPKAENIRIEDIAHALSKLCRYGGHCPYFYSVAQHCVLCSYEKGTPQEQMEFLMHDASEAYMVDLPRPIKRNISQYRDIEDNLLGIIFGYFKLNFPLTERVHEVDNDLLAYEYENFFTNPNPNFEFWDPETAKKLFLARYYELKSQIEKETK